MNFGQYIRAIRKQKGISQRDLAKQVQVNWTYISKIEAGSQEPPSAVAIRHIAQALGTDVSELFYLAGKVPADLGPALKDNPMLTELVCLLAGQRLPDTTYRAMIIMVREMSSLVESGTQHMLYNYEQKEQA